MTTLGITGHRGLPRETVRLVDAALRVEIGRLPEITGVSCLADGAGSLFARAVLDNGGTLVVIVPAARYREGLPAEHHSEYDSLLARASRVVRLDHEESGPQSHMDTSVAVIGMLDRLVAVWDGRAARGFGGTADVVQAALERGVPVDIVWPDGAHRK